MIKGTTAHAPKPRGMQPPVAPATEAQQLQLKYHGIKAHNGRPYHAFEVMGKNRAMYYEPDVFRGILLRHGHTYAIETHKTQSMYVGAEYVRRAVLANIEHQR